MSLFSVNHFFSVLTSCLLLNCSITFELTYSLLFSKLIFTMHANNAEECAAEEFQCNDGKCIDDTFRCDGLYDCADYSDEQSCGKYF